MGIYRRKDSPYYWLHLEGFSRPNGALWYEPTRVRHDAPTPVQRAEAKELARAAYHDRMHELARETRGLPARRPTIMFAAFVDWYEKHELPKRRGAAREREILPRLREAFGEVPLHKLDKQRVSEWITARLSTSREIAAKKRVKARTLPPPSPNTVNREVGLLKSILQAAVPKYLESSPLYGMKLLDKVTPRRRVLTEDEEDRLLAEMAPDDKALYLLAVDSLVRLGDLLDLTVGDDQGVSVWIRDPKAGGGFSVPVSARAREALDAIPREKGEGKQVYLFARRRVAKTERDRRNGIRQMLERYCRLANIAYGRANGVTFHWATRRTGATRMLSRNVPVATVQKVGRWKNPDVVLGIYHELTDEEARAAVEAPGQRSSGVVATRKKPQRGAKRRQSRSRKN